jgi:hypothetical protein
MTPTHVVVDGSNIATEGRSIPSLAQLDDAVRAYQAEFPSVEVIVVVDATFGHRIDRSERKAYDEAVAHGELVSPPAGAVGRGDAFLLRVAQRVNGQVLSNDSFQEFHGEHPWLFDPGRLMGGKPIPGVGWIFTPRTPVRGPTSRAAIAATRRDGEQRPAKTLRAGARGKTDGGPRPAIGATKKGGAAALSPAKGTAKTAGAKKTGAKDTEAAAAPPAGAKRSGRSRAGDGAEVEATTKKKAGAAAGTKKKAGAAGAKGTAKTTGAKKTGAKKTATAAAPPAGAKRSGRSRAGDGAEVEATTKKKAGAAGAMATAKTAEAAKTGSATKTGEATRTGGSKKTGAKQTGGTKATSPAGATKAGGQGTRATPGTRKRSTSGRAGRDTGEVTDAIEAATEEALAPDEQPARRRSRGPRAVANDPLTFLTFAAEHPVGTVVRGTVSSFTSHGAHVDVGGMQCYVPVRALGDPPPRRARDVLERGSTRSFTLTGLDPGRRVAELALAPEPGHPR